MNNCLVTKLKSVVDNDNLPYFGFARVDVDTTGGANAINMSGAFTNLEGSFILGSGTFPNGKTVLDATDDVLSIPANTVFSFMIPKYKNMILSSTEYPSGSSNNPFSMDYDDYKYIDEDIKQGLSVSNFVVSSKSKGNLIIPLRFYQQKGTLLSFVALNNNDVTLDISDETFQGFPQVKSVYLSNSRNITGSIEAFVRNIAHKNATIAKARTNRLLISAVNTKATFRGALITHAVVLHFDGSSSTVNVYSGSAETAQIGTYDIDTDVWTFNE